MCGGGSNSKGSPVDLDMEAGFQEKNGGGVLDNNCSKLLELAAMDDLASFVYEVEEKGLDIDGVNFWYGRSFGSNKMGFEERSPILIASMYGSLEVLKYVVRTGKVDVKRACGSDRATALHCAAAGGSWSSVEVVKILIDASADIDALDVNGRKPGDLIAACVKSSSDGRRRTLEMMLNGIRIEEGDRDGEGGKMKEGTEKKEYPVDTSLPDINVGIYGTDEFRMYTFKVMPCSRAYSHDWTECPFVHPGENARRRDPRKYHYTCVPCPEFKKGNCAKGDNCEYAHGVFESWLHPAQYRTRLCKDEISCSRKVCFFAHKPDELRPLYASTGSGMPSPKSVSVNSMDLTALSPLSLGSSARMLPNTSTPPMSPSITCSPPMGGGAWPNKVNLTPPALQLPGSRLKSTMSARHVNLDAGLDKICTQQRQQLVEEMASLSSPYNRIGDLKLTNLDEVFGGSLDPSLISQLQLQSPTGLKMRQNVNHQLRASYPSHSPPSPSWMPSGYCYDSAAVAAAVMNSRSSTFTKRSQSFIDRSGGSYRSSNPPSPMHPKLCEWSAPDGKLEWGFNGDEMNKLRKSASFNSRSGNASPSPSLTVAPPNVDEPDVSWVHSLVKDAPAGGTPPGQRPDAITAPQHWLDQMMYIEQEQIVA